MECLTWFAPIMQGKLEAWKAFDEQMKGPRKAEHDASRRRMGVTREVASLMQTPQGVSSACSMRPGTWLRCSRCWRNPATRMTCGSGTISSSCTGLPRRCRPAAARDRVLRPPARGLTAAAAAGQRCWQPGRFGRLIKFVAHQWEELWQLSRM